MKLLAGLILGAFTVTVLVLVGIQRRGAPAISDGWRDLERCDSV